MRFEWGADKAASNFEKHGVSFEEASTVFGDILARTDLDVYHSEAEERFITIGMSIEGHLLVVWHMDQEDDDVVRIIGARRSTPSERRAYESGR